MMCILYTYMYMYTLGCHALASTSRSMPLDSAILEVKDSTLTFPKVRSDKLGLVKQETTYNVLSIARCHKTLGSKGGGGISSLEILSMAKFSAAKDSARGTLCSSIRSCRSGRLAYW